MTTIKTQEIAINKVFQTQWDQYRFERFCYSEWSGNITDLFSAVTKILLRPGVIELGRVGDGNKGKFIMVTTKVGNVMIYQDVANGEIKYICDPSYTYCQLARDAGFNEPCGVVKTMAQLEHVFAVADTYEA